METGPSTAIRVLHVITGLFTGGAEMALYNLLSHTNPRRVCSSVVCLREMGPVGEAIRALGIGVDSLNMRAATPDPRAIVRLARHIRRSRPSVIQAWMYHANLLGSVAAPLAGRVPVIWGIHNTTLPQGRPLTRWTSRACALLSRSLPARVVYCAESARRVHTGSGYDARRASLIPNGIDLEKYRPDPTARQTVRSELRVAQAQETPLVGLVARFDPQKEHGTFVSAAARLRRLRPDARFVLCGRGVTRENAELSRWIDAAALGDSIHLLGERGDVERIQAALDVATLCSSAEAFPMVVGEAMACGAPCVVTDAGDAAEIVGETGRVVPVRDPEALAAAWHGLLSMPAGARRDLGLAARRRIETHFSLQRMVESYTSLYETVVHGRRMVRSQERSGSLPASVAGTTS